MTGDLIDEVKHWSQLRYALVVGMYDASVILPRDAVMRLADCVVDELVDAGCVLREPDDET